MTEHAYAAPAGIYGPVDRLGDRPRPRRPGVQPAGAGDLGRAARARLPGRPHRPLQRDVGADHRRARPRGRLRHRALHEPGRRRQHVDDRRRGADRRRRRRSPATRRSTPSPGACCCRRSRPKQIEPWEPEIRKLCRQRLDDMGDDRRRRDGRRRRPAVRPAHPGQRHRPHARLPARGRRPVPRVRPRHAGGRQPRPGGAPGRLRQLDDYIDAQIDDHRAEPRDDLTSYLLDVELGGQKLSPRARPRLDRAAAARRHRHDVERDRLEPVAPRVAPRRPPPAGRRAGADADGDRGAAAGVRPGDDGPHGRRGPRLPRLPDEDRRVGAAAVPGGQPRSRRCSTAPTRSSSTGSRTATPRSASASTAASARTSPASSCASPSRSSSPASPSSSSPTRTPSRGASARSAARASCPVRIL